MVIRTNTNTFTATAENATAKPLYNTNQSITIGGMVKSQVDSRRLKITSQIVIAQSEMADLNAVIEDYTSELYYTPNCTLYDRTNIDEIKVIMSSSPEIDIKMFYDDPMFYITFDFEEVLVL
jgi:hypothetical protein